MDEVHLQWITVAVHLVLAAAVEVNLDQREVLPSILMELPGRGVLATTVWPS